jgi:hypothetical protein
LGGSCDRASTYGPTSPQFRAARRSRCAISGGPSSSSRHAAHDARRRHPTALGPQGRPQQDFAGRRAGAKRRHAPQSGLVGEFLSAAGSDAGRPGPHLRWSLRGEPGDEISPQDRQAALAAYPRIDFKEAIIQAFADGFADKPGTTFGTMNAEVLAEKLPGYVRPNFYSIVRGSKHSV